MVISIPGLTPVAKGRPRITKRGHTYTPEKTKLFEEAVRLSAIAQMRRNGDESMGGPLRVGIALRFKPPKSWPKWKRDAAIAGDIQHTVKPDSDNCCQSVCDALNGAAYGDDSQIVSTSIEKMYAEDSGVWVSVNQAYGFCAATVKRGDIEKAIIS